MGERKIDVEVGSGNIFKDLGLKTPPKSWRIRSSLEQPSRGVRNHLHFIGLIL
jgi:hypothetical protein